MKMFSHFSSGSDIGTHFFNFLILGKSRFPLKTFYTIDWTTFTITPMLKGFDFEPE